MEVAEKLYNQGYISYPRTETDFFSKTIDVRGLVNVHKKHPRWGQYATSLDKGGFQWPKQGKNDDKAHPPIHPVKAAMEEDDNMTLDEWKIYELVTRHFLACCSKDASGFETIVKIEVGGEHFHAKGLQIKEQNYLEIYPYEKWIANILPQFEEGEKFTPKEFNLKESKTTPPSLLTEQELIGLMDQKGIGTDATIHEHIRTIQERHYVEKKGAYFKPTKLGTALVDAYEAAGTDLWKPDLRASMEASMTAISKGTMKKEDFLKKCLGEIEEIFKGMKSKEETILDSMTKHFDKVRRDSNDVPVDYNNLDLAEFQAVAYK